MPVAPPKRALVVIEDGILLGLAANEKIVREFPFLNTLRSALKATPKRSCGRCGGGGASVRATSLAQAKQSIAGLSGDRIQRLKMLLNADKIRVRVLTRRVGNRMDVLDQTF